MSMGRPNISAGLGRDRLASGNFAAALPILLRKLGERTAIKREDIPRKIKDNEVDVFARRPPGDNRRG